MDRKRDSRKKDRKRREQRFEVDEVNEEVKLTGEKTTGGGSTPERYGKDGPVKSGDGREVNELNIRDLGYRK
ncbi:hypothetical protein Csa_008130 [Cucumis sativus]|uniref:Uncharacterized protein n=1 Tax=Cucumis sativus TaxID=3659 RepID=A0A0A0KTA6_CUCSA|nr:hypothetical protein Csa_008130 [Cucumis sativus]